MLSDIVALSSTDAWAVGRYWYPMPLEEKETPEVFALIEHWDGYGWHMLEPPSAE